MYKIIITRHMFAWLVIQVRVYVHINTHKDKVIDTENNEINKDIKLPCMNLLRPRPCRRLCCHECLMEE